MNSVILGIIGPWQLILILIVFVMPLIALIDVLRNRFSGDQKALWILVVLLVPFLGVLLYLFLGRRKRIK